MDHPLSLSSGEGKGPKQQLQKFFVAFGCSDIHEVDIAGEGIIAELGKM